MQDIVLEKDSYEAKTPGRETITISFSSTGDWFAESSDEKAFTLGTSSGKSGKATITGKFLSVNNSNADKSYTVTITSGSQKKRVKVIHPSSFILENLVYEISADACTINVNSKIGIPEKLDIYFYSDEIFRDMYDKGESKSMSSGKCAYKILPGAISRATADLKTQTLKMNIKKNEGNSTRTGHVQFAAFIDGNPDNESEDNLYLSEIITISQSPANVGVSSDFSQDGKTRQLLSHTKGNGIKLVLAGEAFLDKSIKDGSYDAAMKKACDYFFTEEPFKSLKEYFDVYQINTISKNDVIGSSFDTYFSCAFGEGTLITGDDDKAVKVIDKAVGQANRLATTIIVVLNDTRYAGTCSIYSDGKESEIPNGYSIAYVPMAEPEKNGGIGFEQLLHHEAGGHGFGKLADEYAYETQGTITEPDKNELIKWQGYGCYKNVSLKSDVKDSPWSMLAANSLYDYESLGCYEGGYTYFKGVWRPTQESIMNNNSMGFNSPSRYMIYRRAMKIGTGKTASFDEFLDFDKPIRDNLSKGSGKGRAANSTRFAIPHTSPRLHIIR